MTRCSLSCCCGSLERRGSRSVPPSRLSSPCQSDRKNHRNRTPRKYMYMINDARVHAHARTGISRLRGAVTTRCVCPSTSCCLIIHGNQNQYMMNLGLWRRPRGPPFNRDEEYSQVPRQLYTYDNTSDRLHENNNKAMRDHHMLE